MQCPACQNEEVVKNGNIHTGKQNYKCKKCGRQFVENPTNKIISEQTKILIDKLLLEKLPLAGIARVVDVSEPWLQNYVNEKYQHVPRIIEIEEVKSNIIIDEEIPKEAEKKTLSLQCDEMWSFVENKDNKQWIWLALEIETRRIVGVYVGRRDQAGAKQLWESLPAQYRESAICYTDFWAAYGLIIPAQQHIPVGKESGKTSYIERFNNTMRQRISRLVRSTLSFSKNLENHIGAIWLFIHHYNSSLPV
jgi:insertion element IS1 protein InsB